MITIKKAVITVLIGLTGCLIIQCSPKFDESEVIAKVGDAVLTQNIIEAQMALEGIQPDQQREFVERWIDRELLYMHSKSLGLHRSETLQWELERVEKEFLIQKLLDRTYAEEIKISEDEILKYYEANPELFQVNDDEVRVLHILTESRDEARLALREIKAGKNFKEVAKERSMGMFARNGGDMGFIKSNDVIPEISREVFRLPLNQVSNNIISSKFGYHIVKVTDKRSEGDVKSLDQVRNEIVQRIRVKKERSVYYDLLYRLRDKTKIYFTIPYAEVAKSDTVSQ